MKRVRVNTERLASFVKTHEMDIMVEMANYFSKEVDQKKGAGNDYMGWVDLPENYDKEEYARIKKAAEKIKNDSEVLVCIGIGGSYLGAKAVIEALKNAFKKSNSNTEIVFAGHTISADYTYQLLEYLKDKEFSINVISKSGTTTEPAIAFRLVKQLLEQKYGKEEAKGRIYATTDASRGALKNSADEEGYETFVISDDIGGRFSVLTAVGLLPIAVAGMDIDALMAGAKDSMKELQDTEGRENAAVVYASLRNILYNKGKAIEVLVSYEPYLQYFCEWYKQLYGESEGKDQKGIFPASVIFSTDLHSMGQYLQDGRRHLFETVIAIDQSNEDVTLIEDPADLDGLNYIAGKGMDFVNKMAMEGTIRAHVEGGVPNIEIHIDRLDEYNLGAMLYFFEKACAISGRILGINPFDQPGVEMYKKNMFSLLGKPGY